MRLYQIYEDERLIFTGTDSEVQKRFGVVGVGKYVLKNHKMFGKFTVKAIETEKPDITWECLYMMLVKRRELFTQVYTDPSRYVKKLKKLGVDVRIVPSISAGIGGEGLTAPRRKTKAQKCWRVERI